ncbi:transcription termination/antitermination protein NusG [Eubacterium sp. MSJ-13]|uniref:transcription termination/antitermination protein NusG n=1 Tax=Eubacterium sp. MSJ-13 TaxID=2841513 RepID=UPI001C0F3E9C|nr:transcription termination/antitermination protein NusG [Eubacterium sp. MSJ-13]MBU5479600.1 transcription termination/antitermination protein NusG [Eubacterium sp. MSJ-13]
MADTEARWYVAHTYSGYENKVKVDIENTIVNRNLQDQILEVYVPMQEVEREGKDKKKLVQQKMFPAYVLIKMFMNDDTWYVVRNTRGVTGFVGPGSKPVPLTDEEVASMGLMSSVAEAPFSIGDSVIVTSGVWEDTVGIVRQIDLKNKTVTINIDMFGRETPTELSFSDVKVCD